MSAFAVLGVAGGLTFAIRSSMVHVLHGRALHPALARACAAAIPAGLAAIIVVSLASRAGDDGGIRALAMVPALLATRFTTQALVVVGVGMTAFWLLTAQRP
jgi:branched-subunit amino acid transport protein